jgi:hypothetical protein
MFINFTYPSVINHGNGKFLIDDCPIKAVKKKLGFHIKTFMCTFYLYHCYLIYWLVVSTLLINISQLG